MPEISVLLIFTLESTSTIITEDDSVSTLLSSGRGTVETADVTTPSITVNFTLPVIVYPSGATLSSSVYAPSGSPLKTTGSFPDTHVTETADSSTALICSFTKALRFAPDVLYP